MIHAYTFILWNLRFEKCKLAMMTAKMVTVTFSSFSLVDSINRSDVV